MTVDLESFSSKTPAPVSREPQTCGPPEDIDIEHELSEGFAAQLIRRKARQLIGIAGFTPSDRNDNRRTMDSGAGLQLGSRLAQPMSLEYSANTVPL